MNFIKHSNLEGMHAFLGASKYHWLNYDDEKIAITYANSMAAQRGTELHEFAAQAIRLNQKLPKSQKTLNMFVNDSIGFKMTPEVVLFYSLNCYGTTDAISFKNNFLRIHDLKTGVIIGHMEQLYIYAALFCLEYRINPEDIEMELRIYQRDEILGDVPRPEDIRIVMNKIVNADKIITAQRREEG